MKAQKLCCTTVVLTIFDIGIVCAFRLGRNGPPSSGRSAVRAPPVEAARRLGHEAAVSDSRAGPPRRAASGPGTSTGSCARPPSTRPRGGPPGRAARGRSCAPGHVRATEHQAVRARGHTDRPSPAGRAEHEHEQLHEAAGHQTAGHEAAVSDGQARPRTRPQLRTGPPSTRRSERGATPTGRVRPGRAEHEAASTGRVPAGPSTSERGQLRRAAEHQARRQRPPGRLDGPRPGRSGPGTSTSASSCARRPGTRPGTRPSSATAGPGQAPGGHSAGPHRQAASGRASPAGRAEHEAAPTGRVPAGPSTSEREQLRWAAEHQARRQRPPGRLDGPRPGRSGPGTSTSASSCAGPPSTRPAVSDRRAASTGRVRAAAGRARARARAAAPGGRAPGRAPGRRQRPPGRAEHEHEAASTGRVRAAPGRARGRARASAPGRRVPGRRQRPPGRAEQGGRVRAAPGRA